MTDLTKEERTRALIADRILPFTFQGSEEEKIAAVRVTLQGRQWSPAPGAHYQMMKDVIMQYVPEGGAIVVHPNNGGLGCRYRVDPERGRSGGACAVGCFIEDENYRTEMEGTSVGFGVGVDALKDLPFASSAMGVLQLVHDTVAELNAVAQLEGEPTEYLNAPDALCLAIDMIGEARSL